MINTQHENPFFDFGVAPPFITTLKAERYLTEEQIDTIKRCNRKIGRIYLSELCHVVDLPFVECAHILELGGCYCEPTKEFAFDGREELEKELKEHGRWEECQQEYPEILPKFLMALDVLGDDGCDIIVFD
jgi:hypothetical protein